MKTAGTILLVLGIAGLLIFGIQALNDSESFSLFGLDFAVSKADWKPVIASAAITLLGIILFAFNKRK